MSQNDTFGPSGLLRSNRARRAGGEGARGAPPRYVYEGGPIYRAKAVKGVGRMPRDRFAATLDLSAAQSEVLALVGTEPTRVGDIAKQLGRSRSGVTASLYALADRGLVQREDLKGWRRK